MTGSDGRRGKRVAELVRLHFSEVMRRETDDPALAAVVITTVEVSPDLSVATLGVRLLTTEDPDEAMRIAEGMEPVEGSNAEVSVS